MKNIKRFYDSTKTYISKLFIDFQGVLVLFTVVNLVHTMTHILKDAKPEDILKAVESYERKHPHDH